MDSRTKKAVETNLLLIGSYKRGVIRKGSMNDAWVPCDDLPSYEAYKNYYKKFYGDFDILENILRQKSEEFKESIEKYFGRDSMCGTRNICDIIKARLMDIRKFRV